MSCRGEERSRGGGRDGCEDGRWWRQVHDARDACPLQLSTVCRFCNTGRRLQCRSSEAIRGGPRVSRMLAWSCHRTGCTISAMTMEQRHWSNPGCRKKKGNNSSTPMRMFILGREKQAEGHRVCSRPNRRPSHRCFFEASIPTISFSPASDPSITGVQTCSPVQWSVRRKLSW